MPPFELRIAPGAMAEIRAISRWWRANHLQAPRLFDRELAAMLGEVWIVRVRHASRRPLARR